MEKYVIWYVLSLKENIKKRGSWLAVLGMVFLVWVVSEISIPSYKNMQAGIWCGSSQSAYQIKEELLEAESEFEFVEYQSKEELYQDVTAGKIDCGFAFAEDFDEKMNTGEQKDLILYLSTPFTSKGEVLKETVYAAFFKIYSEHVLGDAETDIFGEHDEKRMEQLLEINQDYLQGNEVFQVHMEEIENAKMDVVEEKQVNEIAGLIGLFVFLTMFLAYGRTQLRDSDNVELALGKMERWCYRYVKMLASACIPSVAGMILIVSRTRGLGFCEESVRLVGFVLLCGLWINIVGSALGRAEHLPMWILAFVMVHLIVCPVFFDFSKYVPVIAKIRYLLPLGWYLMW